MNMGNNQVTVIGKIKSKPVFHHEIYGEKVYEFKVEVKRISGVADEINVRISERLLDKEYDVGDIVKMEGQYRSYNSLSNGKYHLDLHIFADSIFRYDGVEQQDFNSISLTGFICKNPIYRKTPLGREISDLIIAVNREYNKSDYIPIILWGRNALYAQKLNVGDKVKICGRIQSREYQKTTENGEEITKTAYEISGNTIEFLDKNNLDTEE
ncbi:single-stranded DNA-binding protein [Lachnospiraceae bacterium MD329]|nr:single-stranded DNA-binding protein [Lachnospiraceae bacterium MD329]